MSFVTLLADEPGWNDAIRNSMREISLRLLDWEAHHPLAEEDYYIVSTVLSNCYRMENLDVALYLRVCEEVYTSIENKERVWEMGVPERADAQLCACELVQLILARFSPGVHIPVIHVE